MKTKKVNLPYKITKTYRIEDLVSDINDEEEINDVSRYVGTYVLKRMSFGDKQASQRRLVSISMRNKGNDDSGLINDDDIDVSTDLQAWQYDVLLYSLISCPSYEREGTRWNNLDEIREYIYGIPQNAGDELLSEAMRMNSLLPGEQGN